MGHAAAATAGGGRRQEHPMGGMMFDSQIGRYSSGILYTMAEMLAGQRTLKVSFWPARACCPLESIL